MSFKCVTRAIVCALISLCLIGTPISGTELIGTEGNVTTIVVNGFYPSDFNELLQLTYGLKKGDTLYLYSQGPGGNAFVCLSMMNHLIKLKKKGIRIVTESAGMAASANACMWIMGDERIVNEGDLIMFHYAIPRGPYGKVDIKDLPPEAQWIFKEINHSLRQRLLNIVRDTETVNDMLDEDENWYNAEELIKLGIATTLNDTE